jgi:hypothetical protein
LGFGVTNGGDDDVEEEEDEEEDEEEEVDKVDEFEEQDGMYLPLI